MTTSHVPLRLLLVLAACAAPPAGAQAPEAIREALAAFAPDAPGCAVAVERDGRTIGTGAAGLADVARQVPITPATVFYAGSVSKQFVATAVHLLAEHGTVALDDPVGHHLPELAPDIGRATLRQLMQHTAGVPDYLSLATRSGRDWADRFGQAEALALLLGQDSLQFEPGSAWRYSNGGYLLLAEVVARTSGQTFRRFADSAMLAPLGMSASHFHDDLDHPIAGVAIGYRADSTERWVAWPLAFAAVGSGGLYTTVEDLARWSANWWHNQLGDRDAELPSRLSARGVLANGDTLTYAMGVVIGEFEGRPVRRHGGGLAGYRAALLQFPAERLGIAVLCNGTTPGADPVAEAVARGYFASR